MSAALCCSSKVCFFQRCAPPSRLNISSILGSLKVRVTPPVSWNGREWISRRCSDSPGRATEGNWITTRSFCTNHRPPHHLCCSSDDHRPQTSSFLFYFLEINQTSDESGSKGKVWLQPESFVHTVWRSTGFSRPPASRYFIADVKSKAVRAEIYRLLYFVADGKRFEMFFSLILSLWSDGISWDNNSRTGVSSFAVTFFEGEKGTQSKLVWKCEWVCVVVATLWCVN